MAVTPVIPSGSTNGQPIKVAATATPGTLIHTAVAGITSIDEVWMWVTNNHTSSAINLTLEIGGVTDPDNLIRISVPARTGLYLVFPGGRLNNGLAIRAFAGSANQLCITAIVSRYAP